MLVLTRKPNQSVVIGLAGGVTITLLELNKHFARIGFQADRSVSIMREELLVKLPTQEADDTHEAVSDAHSSTQVFAQQKQQKEKQNKKNKSVTDQYLH